MSRGVTGRGGAALVVKFTAKKYLAAHYPVWRRQLPDERAQWGRCRFVFDQECREYDWLAAYDDLAPVGEERYSVRTERLACPREHTILLTSEPSSIKVYGSDYLDQFGVIVTGQEPWAIPHPQAVHAQTGIRWYYGASLRTKLSYDRMRVSTPAEKTRLLSTICSSKQQGKALHRLRFSFTERLQAALPELDRFGQGIRPIEDKSEALDPYRYHVAVENHVAPHYWTEKLADAFLGLTLPFYCGCTNTADYFPEESLIRIDIRDLEASVRVIRRAMADNEYEKRLPYIREARRRVLEEHNLFAVLSREIEKRHDPALRGERGVTLYSRHALRRARKAVAVRHGYEKMRAKWLKVKHRSY